MRSAELEFHGWLYLHHGAPCLHQKMIKRVYIDGATKLRMSDTAKAALRAVEPLDQVPVVPHPLFDYRRALEIA